MVEYFKNFWVKGLDFKGRTTRKEYWMTFLSIIIFSFLLGLVVGLIFPFDYEIINGNVSFTGNPTGLIISELIGLAAIVPGLAISVRRMHDIGKSGWWVLIAYLPIVGPIIYFIFLVTPSKN